MNITSKENTFKCKRYKRDDDITAAVVGLAAVGPHSAVVAAVVKEPLFALC